MSWRQSLSTDPLPPLLASDDPALVYFTRRDLLGEDPGSVDQLWETHSVQLLLEKQKPDGSWDYPARRADACENYSLLQTYRMLGILVEMYGLDRRHPAIMGAADYLFAHQTGEGDIRGIFGEQYMPHYSAGMMELLIKAGYEKDERIDQGFQWFEEMQQNDGGWAWPLRTSTVRYEEARELAEPIQPDRSRPFAHALTGFVIRMYAAHPHFRTSDTARHVGELMKSRFFQADRYVDRRSADFWLKFQFPFWWASLLTTLDALVTMGFGEDDHDMQSGLTWFRENQEANGFWPTGYDKGKKAEAARPWVALAICRVLKQYNHGAA